MGRGYELVCRKCRYLFEVYFGVGFNFPLVYQKTINAAKEGKLGRDLQDFLSEHPDGALDCELVMLQCTSCDRLECDKDLSMYIPADEPVTHEGIWSVAQPLEDVPYIAPWDLQEYYRLMKPFEHICEKCGNRMRVIKEKDLAPMNQETGKSRAAANVNCPKCHKPMTIGGYSMWD